GAPRRCRGRPAARRQEVFRSSAVPTIWAKCFALTTQKFNKGRTKPNLSPNGDRSGYKFRSVQGRGQAFFGETSWNGTSGPVEILEGRIRLDLFVGEFAAGGVPRGLIIR